MSNFVQTWSLRKTGRDVWRLRAPATVSGTHERALGARGEFAGVVISAAPADVFAFESRAAWPSGDRYDDAVLEAALDVLLCTGPYNATGVALCLESIEWHDVDSNALSFYLATRRAIHELAGFDSSGYPWKFER